MDDALELPKLPENALLREDNDEQSSGDEDDGPDWTKLPSGNINRPVIPKRGEKDFEPAPGGGSGLQLHHLDRARTAMFNALKSTRAISSKSVSYAVWYPSLGRAHVTAARGIHFTSMGHSIARPSFSENATKAPKRLEFLPEETLYLVEKGALFCWNRTDQVAAVDAGADSAMQGAPMSVQQAFAEIIGKGDLTLEKYHVFAYLRRLGYIVTRAKPPSPLYPIPAPYPPASESPPLSIFRRIFTAIFSPFTRVVRSLIAPAFDWWRPLVHRRWLYHNMDYASIFTSLRFLSSGHSTPLRPPPVPEKASSPYEVFYHLYKPNTPYRKTAPPPPDFSIVVVNARTTPFPTLAELTTLYADLPTLPIPLPRRRNPPPATPANPSAPQNRTPATAFAARQKATAATVTSIPSVFTRLLPFRRPAPPEAKPAAPERRVNPFMALRQGHKTVVIAAVDASVVSFFRIGEGSFEEWPMT